MPNLRAVEIKAFVPSKDFSLSKRFYRDLGFVMASDSGGVAYFHHGDASFLLQDFSVEALAENLTMHLPVGDVDAGWAKIDEAGIAARYAANFPWAPVPPRGSP